MILKFLGLWYIYICILCLVYALINAYRIYKDSPPDYRHHFVKQYFLSSDDVSDEILALTPKGMAKYLIVIAISLLLGVLAEKKVYKEKSDL